MLRHQRDSSIEMRRRPLWLKSGGLLIMSHGLIQFPFTLFHESPVQVSFNGARVYLNGPAKKTGGFVCFLLVRKNQSHFVQGWHIITANSQCPQKVFFRSASVPQSDEKPADDARSHGVLRQQIADLLLFL